MFVYVAAFNNECCKIGRTNSLKKRLEALQNGCPHPVRFFFSAEVEDSGAVERIAHDNLSDWRLKGEWFQVCPDEGIKAVETAIQSYEAPLDLSWADAFDFKAWRQSAELTIREAAAKLGVSKNSIVEWEKGRRAAGPFPDMSP